MTPLPPPEPLALAGIGLVALFGLWKARVQPWLAARRGVVAPIGG